MENNHAEPKIDLIHLCLTTSRILEYPMFISKFVGQYKCTALDEFDIL